MPPDDQNKDLLPLLGAALCLMAAAVALALWGYVQRLQEPAHRPTTAEVRAAGERTKGPAAGTRAAGL